MGRLGRCLKELLNNAWHLVGYTLSEAATFVALWAITMMVDGRASWWR
jgi:hypothetical protein